MRMQTMILNKERNVTLTAYLQETNGEFSNIPKRPAVLILPGGGYRMCSDREADPVAFTYLKAGFQTFVLKYSVGEDAAWPNPLQDYEQAMELIRTKAEEWDLYEDRVAVIGFSAGGHLAACAATVAKNKPAAAILGYAVTEEKTARACLKSAPDVVHCVDENTCPCFVFASRTDNVVPVSNSVRFIQALTENGVMFESHIYAYGPHGFSTADSSILMPGTDLCSRALRWTEDSIAWLKDIWGDFGAGKMTEPKCKRMMNGDHKPYLSVDCTLELLMSNPEAKALLDTMMAEIQKKMIERYGNEKVETQGAALDSSALLENMTLRELLTAGKMPESVVEELNQKLRTIENQIYRNKNQLK